MIDGFPAALFSLGRGRGVYYDYGMAMGSTRAHGSPPVSTGLIASAACCPMAVIALLIASLFAICHIHFTQENLQTAFKEVWQHVSRLMASRRLSSNQMRLEKEIRKTRCDHYLRAVRFTVHFAFLVNIWPLVQFVDAPTFAKAPEILMPLIGWCVDMCFHIGFFPCTPQNVRAAISVNLTAVTLFTLCASPQSAEDLAANEIQHFAANLLASMVFVDSLFTVPFCGMAFLAALYKQAVSPFGMMFSPAAIVEKAAGHLLVALAAVVMEQSVRAKILADFALEDSSRLLASFRQVLRGVCEGEVLLDNHCKVIGRTVCLEQLLALPREDLASRPFADLFEDQDSQKNFSHFIQSSDEASTSIPAGLRVKFRTSHGTGCSVDLFHVLVPNLFQEDGQAQHLIVFKEDAESRIRREAPDATPSKLLRDWHGFQAPSDVASSEGDTLEVYEELQCMTLLVNPEDLGDIEEVHLKFQRQNTEPQINLGMPTLKRFSHAADWQHFRQQLRSYLHAHREHRAPDTVSLGSLLFRLPGESRSYLQARNCSLSVAVGHGPPRFWLLMKDFNPNRLRKMKQSDRGIREAAPSPSSAEPASAG